MLILSVFTAGAQDTTQLKKDTLSITKDTSRTSRDTARMRRAILASLFADSAKLTSSDYQIQIERTYLIFNNIENKSELGSGIRNLQKKLAGGDSVLLVLNDNVLNNTRALNLRNLQVFRTLLLNMQKDLKQQRELLDSTENMLSALKNSLKTVIADTVLRQVWRDSLLRLQFGPQMRAMRETWRSGTRHLKESIATVNLLQTHVSSNSINTTRLLEKVNNLLGSSAERIFSKEYVYLWEKDADSIAQNARSSFERAYHAERRALRYYFKDSGYKRVILLFVGLLFFIWTYRNIRILRRLKASENLRQFGLEYLPSGFIVSTFVITFSIAPLFDLHAPAAYIESMQFLLLIILTIICWKKWPRKLFMYWIAMALLYICFSLTHHVPEPGLWYRCLFIALNILSVVFGLLFLSRMRTHLNMKGFLRFVIILHNVMNVLAIIFNVFGRVSLAQIMGNAAIFAFMQAIGLAVFSKICMEAILLQIITSRIKRGITNRFEYKPVLNSFGRPVLSLSVILWLIVFTTNLNIYSSVLNGLSVFLEMPRHIGNASFTVGGILLFFMIIWIAHLLQKYVGYFFGDTGNEDEVQNKGQRSRLLVARLILLSLGYLLAVAASGIPVDKITIVLGALGVGIGLGLQNIVNNFVSGIILIFDRPLQIGDLVEVGDKVGRVREIGVRSSTLLTKEGAEVIIPNGDILSTKITNWTLSNSQQRLEMDVSINGASDMEVVSSTIKKAILSSQYVFANREPQILFTKINGEGFDLKVFFWCTDAFKCEEAKSEIMLLLHDQMRAENINMN
jgi:small-conductance mechanosensitive channel